MVLLFVGYFFLISVILSVALHAPPLRRTRLARWWHSRGVRLIVASVGVIAGLLVAAYGFVRQDWVDLFVGLVVAAVFARDINTLRRLPS